jgi:hypothetical protein
LNTMYKTNITADTFFESLENGVLLCEHSNNIVKASSNILTKILYRPDARPQTFQARDNISNFIKWCRNTVHVRECLMFETDDLILRKNEKNFILCLLEIARFGSKYGLNVPQIIKFEQEIDNELNNNHDSLPIDDNEDDDGPENDVETEDSASISSLSSKSMELRSSEYSSEQEQAPYASSSSASTTSSCDYSINKGQKSSSSNELHKHVNKLVKRCTCQKQLQFTKLSEGKYRIGNTKTIVFIRVCLTNLNFLLDSKNKQTLHLKILRNHIMVRVGGGWNTVSSILDVVNSLKDFNN